MRPSFVVAGVAVLATRLVLASIIVAQTAAGDPSGPVEPPHIEAGLTAGTIMVAAPEFGLIASLPLSRRSAVEVMACRAPAFFDAPPHAIVTAQLRAAFSRAPRSRKSVLLGVTRVTALGPSIGIFGTGQSKFVRPHLGLSWQWPITDRVDSRFDVIGIATLERQTRVVPRAVASWVWHASTRGSR